MPDRQQDAQDFLKAAGWNDASRVFLAGDASDRSYDRLTLGAKTAILMDAPPGKGDDPADFVKIARHLSDLGLSSPRIFFQDFGRGFLLIEDLGDDLFARLCGQSDALDLPLYAAACDVLLHIQSKPAPTGLLDLSAHDWANAANLALDWYRFAALGDRLDSTALQDVLAELLLRHADGPRVLILRDFHAENLLWLPHRSGLARVGLLDFQLAQMGQPAYDLVSLLQDARRDVSPSLESEMIRRFANRVRNPDFDTAYAVLGAQRALRILGVFARLCLLAGKVHYIDLLPRVWGHLQRNFAHPSLAPLSEICAELLPEPTTEILERIRAQCGTTPKR